MKINLKLKSMTLTLKPHQIQRLIQLTELAFLDTDTVLDCGLKNDLKQQYEAEQNKVDKALNELTN